MKEDDAVDEKLERELSDFKLKRHLDVNFKILISETGVWVVFGNHLGFVVEVQNEIVVYFKTVIQTYYL